MSKKQQKLWQLKENCSIMNFQKRAPEYLVGKLLDNKNACPFCMFNSGHTIDRNNSAISKYNEKKLYLKRRNSLIFVMCWSYDPFEIYLYLLHYFYSPYYWISAHVTPSSSW
jgi:hypothetical protein